MKIAKENSITLLEGEETLVVDPGYQGHERLLNPLPGNTEEEKEQNEIMNYLRQNVERMNNRIKIFNAARWSKELRPVGKAVRNVFFWFLFGRIKPQTTFLIGNL